MPTAHNLVSVWYNGLEQINPQVKLYSMISVGGLSHELEHNGEVGGMYDCMKLVLGKSQLHCHPWIIKFS